MDFRDKVVVDWFELMKRCETFAVIQKLSTQLIS